MAKELPKFKSDGEAAEFWDKTDASGYMDGGEAAVLTWEPLEDRCPCCGNKMNLETDDIHLSEGQVTIHGAKRYHCLACGHEQWSQEFKKKVPSIARDLVEIALSR